MNGGVVFIYPDGDVVVEKCATLKEKGSKYTKSDTKGMANILIENIRSFQSEDDILYIEYVHSFPTDGRASAFSFGYNFGAWEGIISSLDLSINRVLPRMWQQFFKIPSFQADSLAEAKKLRKRWLKRYAEQSFNKQKITFKTSDACLIALYARDIADNDGKKIYF